MVRPMRSLKLCLTLMVVATMTSACADADDEETGASANAVAVDFRARTYWLNFDWDNQPRCTELVDCDRARVVRVTLKSSTGRGIATQCVRLNPHNAYVTLYSDDGLEFPDGKQAMLLARTGRVPVASDVATIELAIEEGPRGYGGTYDRFSEDYCSGSRELVRTVRVPFNPLTQARGRGDASMVSYAADVRYDFDAPDTAVVSPRED